MGKVKTRLLGMEEVEEKQKKEQKEKSTQKKATKTASVKTTVNKEEAIKKTPPVESLAKSVKTPKRAKAVVVKPRGKRYEVAKKMVDKNKSYQVKEAVSLLKKIKSAGFDESVELHLVVDQMGLKGELDLPYSTGKIVKVAVVDEKVLTEIEKGKLDFDILVTHPSFMPKLAKFAKVLGPKGLMPNPKSGTISPNPEELVKKFSKGLLRWKTEAKSPLIHQMIGKLSIEEKNLVANAEKFIEAVGKKHIQKGYIKSTMSPSFKILIQE
ncbi:hypothetical protein HZA76_00080 [Candidatus Roizmanbacteria bacterium]|nr:hypothetical protein [Candidatus Roizmanbacteria bacterium]